MLFLKKMNLFARQLENIGCCVFIFYPRTVRFVQSPHKYLGQFYILKSLNAKFKKAAVQLGDIFYHIRSAHIEFRKT